MMQPVGRLPGQKCGIHIYMKYNVFQTYVRLLSVHYSKRTFGIQDVIIDKFPYRPIRKEPSYTAPSLLPLFAMQPDILTPVWNVFQKIF